MAFPSNSPNMTARDGGQRMDLPEGRQTIVDPKASARPPHSLLTADALGRCARQCAWTDDIVSKYRTVLPLAVFAGPADRGDYAVRSWPNKARQETRRAETCFEHPRIGEINLVGSVDSQGMPLTGSNMENGFSYPGPQAMVPKTSPDHAIWTPLKRACNSLVGTSLFMQHIESEQARARESHRWDSCLLGQRQSAEAAFYRDVASRCQAQPKMRS